MSTASGPEGIDSAVRSWASSLDEGGAFAGLLYRTSFQAALGGQLFVRGVELAGETGPGAVTLSATRDAASDPFLAMPFEQAVAFFRDKRVISEAEFDTLRDRFRQGGFIARRLATERLQQVARDSIQRLLEQGATIPEAVAQIRDAESDINASLGISPVSSAYLDNVLRTNVASAYGAGRWQAINDPNVRALRPWVQYRTAGDSRVRPGHAALAGLVFASGSELAARYAPPLFYQCFPGETVVQGQFEAAYRALYVGEIVEITTKHGRRLAVTPNHPVATPRGFVPAEAIREGDHLFGYEAPVELDHPAAPQRPNVDEEHAPSRIDQVFGAIEESLSHRRWSADGRADDFDGDARSFEGQVEVVAAEGPLPHWVQAGPAQRREDLVLASPDVSRHAGEGGESSLRDLVLRVGAPAAGSVSGSDLPSDGDRVGLELRPLQALRFGAASRLDVGFDEPSSDRQAVHSKVIGDLLLRVTGDVPSNDGGVVERAAVSSYGVTGNLEPLVERSLRDADGSGDRRGALSGIVSLDEVVGVQRREWSGHVYDLQSPRGWIVADGIFTSNCRCVMVTLSDQQFADRGLAETTTRVDGIEREEFWAGAPAPLSESDV